MGYWLFTCTFFNNWLPFFTSKTKVHTYKGTNNEENKTTMSNTNNSSHGYVSIYKQLHFEINNGFDSDTYIICIFNFKFQDKIQTLDVHRYHKWLILASFECIV